MEHQIFQSLMDDKYKNQFITVSNEMIRARENTTLLESKIEALAMHYMNKDVHQRKKEDADGNDYVVNYVVLPIREVTMLMGRDDGEKKRSGGRTYTEITAAAMSMKQKFFIIEDRKTKKFAMKSLYGDIRYDNGLLDIEFEPSMNKYFMELKQNFSKLKLSVLFSFTKNGGLQLYKLLRSYAYSQNLGEIDLAIPQESYPSYSVSWTLTDLRMLMGYIDISQSLLRKEGSKSKPNWDKMEKIEKNPQYRRWGDFNSRVIIPGAEEINRISDIYIKDVITERSGKGGKVGALTFVIQHNKAYYEKHSEYYSVDAEADDELPVVLTAEQKDDFVDDIDSLLNEKLKTKDLRAIAEAADYRMDRIKHVYALSKNSKNIKDIVGWMISGLRNEYSAPVKGSSSVSSFNDFKQREYDYEELEDIANEFI